MPRGLDYDHLVELSGFRNAGKTQRQMRPDTPRDVAKTAHTDVSALKVPISCTMIATAMKLAREFPALHLRARNAGQFLWLHHCSSLGPVPGQAIHFCHTEVDFEQVTKYFYFRLQTIFDLARPGSARSSLRTTRMRSYWPRRG